MYLPIDYTLPPPGVVGQPPLLQCSLLLRLVSFTHSVFVRGEIGLERTLLQHGLFLLFFAGDDVCLLFVFAIDVLHGLLVVPIRDLLYLWDGQLSIAIVGIVGKAGDDVLIRRVTHFIG